ncbi:MAG TPA: tRNA (adenine-N1)-methyltransferase [Candidatus Thermoplasmatota archaeon]|nr:tRNA (adenine-N1)-methyltransferase [Candidatus Thermoplasmatota archaeon]
MAPFAPGDRVVLLDPATGERLLVVVGGGVERVKGLGTVDLARLVGVEPGARFEYPGRAFIAVAPTVRDLLETVARKAQVVTPKDAARIVFEADLRAGARVVEAGVGSASLTLALARAVAPTGRVTTYEIREDFAEWGRANLARAGLADVAEVKVGDVAKDVVERDLDAFVLDVPEPWLAVSAAWNALKGGGVLVTYSPLVSQVEATHRALADHPFTVVRAFETMEREWVVGERGARPSFEMLGHTGFVTVARKRLQ